MMNQAQLVKIAEDLVLDSVGLMKIKNNNYANQDGLSNFKLRAKLTHSNVHRAIFDSWLKHLIAIITMTQEDKFNPDTWREFLIDNINYSCIMYASLLEANADDTVHRQS
jgi:hypothetical protein